MNRPVACPVVHRTVRELTPEEVFARLREAPHAQRQGYRAMYSSWYGGIIRDPQMMMLPIDDHIVHRGDGVFEAIKCVDGRLYGLDRHLERMARSAALIGLVPPQTLPEIREICLATTKASGLRDAILRLYVSRGPGGFTANPYESIAAQIYLVITELKPVATEKYEKGASVKISAFCVKEGVFATVKSCNYLQNVMMKKEAVDGGVDFTVSRDERGFLAEGSTENFALISERGEFLVPGFERTLKGVTAVRMMELAESLLIPAGVVRAVRNESITEHDVLRAREAMMLGTTLDVLPVTSFEGQPIGRGEVGPVCREFLRVMREDLRDGPMVTVLD